MKPLNGKKSEIANFYDLPEDFFAEFQDFITGKQIANFSILEKMWLKIFDYAEKNPNQLDFVRAMSEIALSLRASIDTDLSNSENDAIWETISQYAGLLEVAENHREKDNLITKIKDEFREIKK